MIKLKRINKYQEGGFLYDHPEMEIQIPLLPQYKIQPKITKDDLNQLSNFTKSFETYKDRVYELAGQNLAGYGSANPEILKLAKNGQLTEEIAAKEVTRHLAEVNDALSRNIPNWEYLDKNTKMALIETGYNIGTYKFLKESPKLMKMIDDGIFDSKELVKEMDHNKSDNSWLGARSAARRAMALGEYNWDWPEVDIYGRQKDSSKYQGKEDWKASPYYGVYKQGGTLKRIPSGKSGIRIKPENKGKFTEYCGGKVTSECIARGKKSPNPKIRKQATFAGNARKWNK